jgi:hypothetical protein
MPLLFDSTSIQVVITPLNLLGEQNVMDLKRAGIKAREGAMDQLSTSPSLEYGNVT